MVFVLFGAIYLFLSLYTTLWGTITTHAGDTWSQALLVNMVEGNAHRPFVFRRLVPEMIGAVDAVLPETVKQSISYRALRTFSTYPLKNILRHHTPLLKPEKIPVLYLHVIFIAILFLCVVGYMAALYKISMVLMPGQWGMALAVPIVGAMIPPALTYQGMYIYDFSCLTLAACGYYCLAARRWKWYGFWFLLACLNKETAILLTVFFAFWFFPRMGRKAYFLALGAQLLTWGAIRLVIYDQFSHTPGVPFMTHFMMGQFMGWLNGYGHRPLIIYFTAAFLLLFRWQDKPLFARYGLWPFTAMFVLFMIFGKPDEYRVFMDVIPLLAVLITHTLVEGTGLSKIALVAPRTGEKS